jgi:hypothetical protein
VQLLAGASAASAAIAIGGCDAHETVEPPASAFVSLSMLRKTAPPPTRARKARARSLRTEEGPQTMGRGTPAGGGGGLRMATAVRRVCARYSLRALTCDRRLTQSALKDHVQRPRPCRLWLTVAHRPQIQ